VIVTITIMLILNIGLCKTSNNPVIISVILILNMMLMMNMMTIMMTTMMITMMMILSTAPEHSTRVETKEIFSASQIAYTIS